LILGLLIATVWVLALIPRPEVLAMPGTGAPSNPLHKEVLASGKGWYAHFQTMPWMFAAPFLALIGFSGAWLLGRGKGAGCAFMSSSIGIVGLLLTLGFGLFPFLLISTTNPASSLLIWDASSSQKTLLIAFWITVVFLPIVLLYTRWVYKIIWGTVTEAAILKDQHTLY
jgi:cytochrome bd ubiquinol oxidase subunit II